MRKPKGPGKLRGFDFNLLPGVIAHHSATFHASSARPKLSIHMTSPDRLRRPFAAVTLLFILSASAWAFRPPSHTELPNFDRRGTNAPPQAPAEKRPAIAALRTRLPGARVDFDEHTGAPKWVVAEHGFLSGKDAQGRAIGAEAARAIGPQEEHRATKAFLHEHKTLFGFGPEVLTNARLKHDFVTAHSGLRTVVWEQELDGVPVFQGLLISHTTTNSELVNLSSHFVPNLAHATGLAEAERSERLKAPAITAAQAVALAGQNLEEDLTEADLTAVAAQPEGAVQRQRFTAASLNGEADAKLIWLPMSQQSLRLCWDVMLTSRARGEMFRLLIDAQTGEALVRHCLTEYLSDATYRVYTSDSPSPFSPGHPTPSAIQPPVVARSLVTLSAVDTNASPAGWINDSGNETWGNNVDAHTDRDANNVADLPRPQGSPARTFDFTLDLAQAPSTYTNAAVTDLFYWCNWMHDKLYALGFTEAARNFQSNNFARGGLGNDALQADAQDGSDFNNANMSTPSDGSAPRMQMFVFTGPTPDRDGDLDHEIVLHEYTHGLSNRRVGGGVGLSALQSRGMGEGWSDWYALALLSELGDDVNGVYAAGAYATYQLSGLTTNYYFGIRRYPYSTDLLKNPLTFKDIDPAQASLHPTIPRSPIIGTTADEVHNSGEVWCATLWEARANLITKHGFSVGNELILRLVTDGMNLSPANPNFLQARDAILQADAVNNGGANLVELWAAFAKRGMGFSASSPASSTTVGLVEAYDVPDYLSILPTSLVASGQVGGPFSPGAMTFVLTNTGTTNLNWSLVNTSVWFNVSPTSGALTPGGPANTVNVTILPAANALPAGAHVATIRFTNTTSGVVQSRTVTLNAVGLGVADDFDPGLDLSQWSAFGGTVGTTVLATNFGSYASSPNSLWFGDAGTRHATTIPINTSGGGAIAFALRIASGSGWPWETADLPGEGIVFEASTNGGTTWNLLNTFNTTTYQIWTTITSTIPIAARSPATLFRWRQLSHSGDSFDHWALDNVLIDATPATILTLAIPTSSSEGAAPSIGTVAASPAPTNDLTVTLTSLDISEVTVPVTVTILAGQSNATFNLTIVDDVELDGTQIAQLTAAAPNYSSATATLNIFDNETATLSLAIPATVTEGSAPVQGTVSASAAPTASISVNLSSSDTTEILVPASVVIPAGQTSTVFSVSIVNDTQIDGAQTVAVTAQVTNWTSALANTVVEDNEPTNLVVTLPASAREGNGTLTSAGSVRISGTLPTNLVVALLSSDTTEVTAPPTVTLLAGQVLATFDLTIVDDPDIDSSQPVSVTASAAGFSNGSTNMTVTDDESPLEPFNPSPAHLATNVIQTSDLAWSSGALPGEVITNEVYFGTNPTPGLEELLGTTTNTTWTLPTLAPQTTYYWQIVARKAGTTAGPVWQFTTRGVDHFTWSALGATQYVNQPFEVTVTAQDAFDTTVTNFAGPVQLSAWQGQGGTTQTVQVLSFTAYADTTTTGEYRNTLNAISNYFPSFVETAITATNAAALQTALAGKHVFLIPEQESGSSSTLASLGTAWTAVLSNFVKQGGIVIACSWSTDEHMILSNSGLMSMARVGTTSSETVFKAAEHVVTENVASSFSGSYISWYTGNGQAVIRNSTSNAVVMVRDVGAGHVILIGSDFYTPNTGMDRVLANAVRWAQSGTAQLSLTPTNTGTFSNGVWSGNVVIAQLSTNAVLRADDGSGHTGLSAPIAVELQNDIAVSVLDSPDPVSTGANVTYTITVTNIGPASASNVTVTNLLPVTAQLVSVTPSQGTFTTSSNRVVCALDTFNGNSFATITIVAALTNAGTFTNQVFVARAETDAYAANNAATATTTVQNPVVVISDKSVGEGNTGTTSAAFSVSVSPAPAVTASVNFATISGSALAPSDFIHTNGTLVFAPGETNKTVQVAIIGDALYELNENFYVNLSLATNVTINDSQAIGTILNDDPIPMLSVGDVTVTERNLGTTSAVFMVSLSTTSGVAVTASYATVNGNATSGSDYVARSGSFTLPAGITSTNFAVTVNGDLSIEPDEVFYFDLSSVANAVLLKREGVGLIVNDDGLPGELDRFVWTVPATPQVVGQPFNVTINALDAYGNPADNFTGIAYLNGTGGGSATSTILGNPAHISSSSGTFTLGYSFTPSTNLTVTHLRSYFGTKVSLWTDAGVLLASQTVSAGSGTWTDTPLPTPVTLNAGTTYRVAAYTGGGNYYWRTDGSNSFPAGVINQGYEASGDVFPTLSDSVRWWFVDLRYVTGGNVPLSPAATGPFAGASWTGDIAAFAPATNLVLRADDGNGHFGSSSPLVVELRDDLGLAMTAAPNSIAVGGSLTNAIELTNTGPTSATGIFLTNLLPANVTLLAVNASQGTYSLASNAVICDIGTLGANASATVSIVLSPLAAGFVTNSAVVTRAEAEFYLANNSASAVTAVVTPSLTIADVTVTEGASGITNAVFTVTATPAPGQTITVNFATVNSSASAPDDYTSTNGILTFAPGEATKTISVPVNGDLLYESTETFNVLLSSPTNGTIADTSGIGTILNDDLLPVITIGDAIVSEGNTGTTNATFTLTLSAPSGLSASVFYNTANGTAIAPADYTSVSSSVTFNVGETNKTIVVSVKGDTTNEPNEIFYVYLSSSGNATIGDSQGLGTILNDDLLPTVRLAAAVLIGETCGNTNGAPDPGEYVTFNLTLTNASLGGAAASNLSATLLAAGGIVGPSAPQNFGALLPGGAAVTRSFSFTGVGNCGDELSATLVLQDGTNALGPVTFPVRLGKQAASFAENFDSVVAPTLPSGWTVIWSGAGSPWSTSTANRDTLPNAAYCPDPGSTSANSLTTPAFPLTTTNALLSFRHYYSTESCCDRCYLQISIAGGAFQDLNTAGGTFLTNGYTSGGWGGSSGGFITTAARLPAAALGKSIQLRWHFTSDSSVSGLGWYVDSITLGDGYTCCQSDDLMLGLTASPDPVALGGTLTYTLAITNNGPSAATGVLVTNVLPAGVTFLSATASQGSCTNSADLVTCDLGVIAASANATVSIQVQANALGSLTNVATVYRTETDPNPFNNSISAVSAVTLPSLMVSNAFVFEGNTGTTPGHVTVTCWPPPGQPVSVSFLTTDGTALAGSDYIATNGVLNFATGQTNLVVAIPIIGDTNTETAETFSLILSSPVNATLGIATNTVTIVNDDNYGRVAVLGAPSTATWNNDVVAKILGTGNFAQVDGVPVSAGNPVPTLSQLQQYAAVLVYSDTSFNSPTALGDVLADYADSGGGVVLCTFAFSAAIQGRLNTGGYLPFTTGGQSQPGGLTLVKDQPTHDILDGVASLHGGTSSFHNTVTLSSGAVLVAHWSNNQPLVGTKETGIARVVGLNFYPPSSTVRSDFWMTNTDGGQLMANALSWASRSTQPAPSNAALVFQSTELLGDQLKLTLGTSDSSPITPQRASNIWIYASTNLSLPMTSWTALSIAPLLTNGVMVVEGINTTNPPLCFFRGVEGAWTVLPLEFRALPANDANFSLEARNNDRSPISPMRAKHLHVFTSTSLELPFGSWEEVDPAPLLGDGVLRIHYTEPTNSPARFFRIIESP